MATCASASVSSYGKYTHVCTLEREHDRCGTANTRVTARHDGLLADELWSAFANAAGVGVYLASGLVVVKALVALLHGRSLRLDLHVLLHAHGALFLALNDKVAGLGKLASASSVLAGLHRQSH